MLYLLIIIYLYNLIGYLKILSVLDEIGIDSIGQMSRAPQVNTRDPTQVDTVTDDEIEKQLKALGL